MAEAIRIRNIRRVTVTEPTTCDVCTATVNPGDDYWTAGRYGPAWCPADVAAVHDDHAADFADDYRESGLPVPAELIRR